MSKNLVGTRIKELRKAQGLTQVNLATQFQLRGWDMSHQTIAKIETGVKPVRDIEIVQLSLILDVPIAEIFQISDLQPRLQKYIASHKK
ncbi:helix-turn-helix domain-containing protein [Vibrio cyclitrophicus]